MIVTTNALHVVVRGTPTTQGSHMPFVSKSTGRPMVIEQTGKALKTWRAAVEAAARVATAGGRVPPMRGPLVMAITFTLARPRKHFRTGRYATLLRDDAPPYPDYPPDSSKLLRAAEDALTIARAWGDDGQVVQTWLAKYWVPVPFIPGGTWNLGTIIKPCDVAGVPDADVMPEPGAVIRIAELRRNT